MTLGGSSGSMFFVKWLDGSGFIASILKWCRWPGVCFRYRYTISQIKTCVSAYMNPLMQKVIKVHFNGNNKKSTNCFGENLLQVCLVTSADGLAFFSMPLNKRFWWLNGGEGFRGSLSLPFLHNCSDLYFKGHFNFYMLRV